MGWHSHTPPCCHRACQMHAAVRAQDVSCSGGLMSDDDIDAIERFSVFYDTAGKCVWVGGCVGGGHTTWEAEGAKHRVLLCCRISGPWYCFLFEGAGVHLLVPAVPRPSPCTCPRPKPMHLPMPLPGARTCRAVRCVRLGGSSHQPALCHVRRPHPAQCIALPGIEVGARLDGAGGWLPGTAAVRPAAAGEGGDGRSLASRC